MDSASAHHSKVVKPYVEEHFIDCRQVVYTPEFNVVEKAWAHIKPLVRKMLAVDPLVRLNKNGFEELIMKATHEVCSK